MSFAAIQWAWEQPVKPAMRKLVLLAMADCVNAEGAEMVCWPSYAFIASRTGMNTRTVETSVFDLKTEGYLVDTGRRAGTTAKVVVYRLNTPETCGIKPGQQASNANGTRPKSDGNTSVSGGIDIPPKATANPPKNGGRNQERTWNWNQERTWNRGGVRRTSRHPGIADCRLDESPQGQACWPRYRHRC